MYKVPGVYFMGYSVDGDKGGNKGRGIYMSARIRHGVYTSVMHHNSEVWNFVATIWPLNWLMHHNS